MWIDAQLPPQLARWVTAVPDVEATHTFDLGFLGAADPKIFEAARHAGAVVITKDVDFVELLERHGAPPQVVWITAGNTTNAVLRRLIDTLWPRCAELLRAGHALVEIRGAH